ncbi:hypothetical protein LTR91_026832, partial [Friedmanniomyces endolithicus]
EYFKAGQAYQSALDAGGEGKLRQDISRNLAQVDLILGRNEQARLNALNALSDNSHSTLVALDVKAYFRAASASYQLRDFRQCEEYLTKLLSLSVNDEDGARLLEKKAFSATFGWKSDNSSTKTYDVRRKTFDGLPAALWMSTVQKLQQTSPQRIAEVTSLTGRYPGLGSKLVTADGVHVLDAFQIHDIIAANAFAIPTSAKRQKTEAFGLMETVVPPGTKASTIPENYALFTHASLINHSCLPNASRVFIGDAILLRATKAVAKGDEILQAYVSPTLDVKARQERMNLIWNFICSCALCKAETQEPEDLRQRRAAVVEEADRLAHDINTHLVDASQRDGIIRRAERLHARLKATFASEIWD